MKYTMNQNFSTIARRTILTVAMLSAIPVAFAANTAPIKVIGTITPAACSVAFAGTGVFDYGTISAGTLSNTQANNLGAKTNTMTISCTSAATKVALTTTDNVPDSRFGGDGVAAALGLTDDTYLFGLGKASDGTPLGAYRLYLMQANLTVDGQAARYIQSPDKGNSWANVTGNRLLVSADRYPDWRTSWTTGDQTAPIAAQNVSIPVQVTAAIRPLDKLPSSGDLTLDGQTTVTLFYL